MLFSGTARWRSLAWVAIVLQLAAVPARSDEGPEPTDEIEVPEPSDEIEAPTDVEPIEEEESVWSDAGIKVVDAVVVRPLGAVATVAGLAFFVISAPLVAPSGNLPVAWEVFFLGPAEYTFRRPLGDL